MKNVTGGVKHKTANSILDMCRLDVKKSYFGGAHKHIIVKKFGLNDNVATEMKELLVIVIIKKRRNCATVLENIGWHHLRLGSCLDE